MPHWDAARQRLIFVDINSGLIHDLDPRTGELASTEVASPLGFAVPVAGSTTRLCGNGNDVIALDLTGVEIGRMPIEPDMPGNRLNEGKADPRGRLWTGSMSKTREPDQAGLYRLDRERLAKIRTITLGNGTDWDVQRDRMYHVDSVTQQIDVWDYDVATGEVENRRVWAKVNPNDGAPDGLTIDAEGCVWLCLFRGGAVRRFDPDGAPMADIALPTPFVTCRGVRRRRPDDDVRHDFAPQALTRRSAPATPWPARCWWWIRELGAAPATRSRPRSRSR